MKIIELFEADYETSIRKTLIDHLVSLISTGQDKISVKQAIRFLRQTKRIFINRDQIEDLLSDTNFSVEGNDIVVKPEGEDEEEPDNGDIAPPPEPQGGPAMGGPSPDRVVGNMAQNQISKGIG